MPAPWVGMLARTGMRKVLHQVRDVHQLRREIASTRLAVTAIGAADGSRYVVRILTER